MKKKIIISVVCSALILSIIGCILAYNFSTPFKKFFNKNFNIKTEETQTASGSNSEKDDSVNIEELQNKLELTIAELESTKAELEQVELEKAEIVEKLTAEKIELENSLITKTQEIEDLNSSIEEKEMKISELELDNSDKMSQIEGYEKQIAVLENENIEKQKLIDIALDDKVELQNIIEQNSQSIQSLNNQISALNSTIDINTETINSLNMEILVLNTKINNLIIELQDNVSLISVLNYKIVKLNDSLAYYEDFVSTLKTDNQSVVYFYFDDAIYNIQFITNGSSPLVTNPTSTEKIQFNYWEIDGVRVILEELTITEDTKIDANVTYNYSVDFVNGDNIIESQMITKNSCCQTSPVLEDTEDSCFAGWSIDGVNIVDVSTYMIKEDTTFYAIFYEKMIVTFNVDGVCQTQFVNAGEKLIVPDNPTKEDALFMGWSIDGVNIIDLTDFIVSSDVTFIPVWSNLVTVKFIYPNNSSEYSIYEHYIGESNSQTDLESYMETNYYDDLVNAAPDGYHYVGLSLSRGSRPGDNTFLAPIYSLSSKVYVIYASDTTVEINHNLDLSDYDYEYGMYTHNGYDMVGEYNAPVIGSTLSVTLKFNVCSVDGSVINTFDRDYEVVVDESLLKLVVGQNARQFIEEFDNGVIYFGVKVQDYMYFSFAYEAFDDEEYTILSSITVSSDSVYYLNPLN